MNTKWLIFKRLSVLVAALACTFSMLAFDLRPDLATLQCGGDMGLPTVGVAWQYGKAQHFETDLMVGLIPKYSSSSAKAIFTLKENYVPWHIKIRTSRFTVHPFTASFFITYTASEKMWAKQPSRYPAKYYVLPTKLRLNISVGQRITYTIKSERSPIKTISAFYELCTCDYYLANAFGNSYLKPSDWLTLTLGIKLGI